MLEMILDMLLFEDGVILGCCYWLVIICIVVLIGLIIWLIMDVIKSGYNNWYIRANTNEIVTEDVIATVVKKEYTPGHTTLITAGKCLIPVMHSPSYDVSLSYDDEVFVFDCKELYNEADINDKILAKLSKYISKNGDVLETELEIGS